MDAQISKEKSEIIRELTKDLVLPISPESLKKLIACNGATLLSEIKKNPPIAMKMLSVANSSLYGFPRKVGVMEFASVILGPAYMKKIAERYPTHNFFSLLDYNVFCKHSILTAHIANAITHTLFPQQNDSMYTCGLIHNLGILALTMCKSDTLRILMNEDAPLTPSKELEMFGTTRHELIYEIARAANLPIEIQNAVLFCSNPNGAEDEESRKRAFILNIASYHASLELRLGTYISDIQLKGIGYDVLEIERETVEMIVKSSMNFLT